MNRQSLHPHPLVQFMCTMAETLKKTSLPNNLRKYVTYKHAQYVAGSRKRGNFTLLVPSESWDYIEENEFELC